MLNSTSVIGCLAGMLPARCVRQSACRVLKVGVFVERGVCRADYVCQSLARVFIRNAVVQLVVRRSFTTLSKAAWFSVYCVFIAWHGDWNELQGRAYHDDQLPSHPRVCIGWCYDFIRHKTAHTGNVLNAVTHLIELCR